MQFSRHYFILFVFTGLIGLIAPIAQPATAQSDPIQMQLITDVTGSVFVYFPSLPASHYEIRWQWNEPPTDEAEWQPLHPFSGAYYRYVTSPPDTGNPVCQHHAFYAELRDLSGDIITLSTPFTIDEEVDVLINVLWPEQAMNGYTNQDSLVVQVIDQQDCSGLQRGRLSIGGMSHNLIITPPDQTAPFYAYQIPLQEGEMRVQFFIQDKMRNTSFQDFTLVRDVTPPTLANTRAAIQRMVQPAQLTITGEFSDVYAPLPWAIEWQFLNSDGAVIGDPVFHTLNAEEVQSTGSAFLMAESNPFQINVSVGAIPDQAAALHVKLFDRAGNSQAIAPVQLTTVAQTYSIYLPLIDR